MNLSGPAMPARAAPRPTDAEPPRWRWAVGLAAIGSSALVMAGALLPWLSVYAGLKAYAGVAGLNGRLLLGAGAIGLLAGVAYLFTSRLTLRWAVGLWGFGLLAFAGWLVVQLLVTYQRLAADPLFLARLGPGLFVASIGAAALAATLLLGPAKPMGRDHQPPAPVRPLASVLSVDLALLSAAAATIHFAVLGPHLGESWLLGVFFAATAVAQLAWALLVLTRPSRWVLLAGAIGNALVILVWIVSRTVGVPVGAEAGGAEPVGFADALSTAYEALIVVGAVVVLAWPATRQAAGREPRSGWARIGTWALAAVVVPLTAVAMLSAVGILPLTRHA
jgi:hypothetical protein